MDAHLKSFYKVFSGLVQKREEAKEDVKVCYGDEVVFDRNKRLLRGTVRFIGPIFEQSPMISSLSDERTIWFGIACHQQLVDDLFVTDGELREAGASDADDEEEDDEYDDEDEDEDEEEEEEREHRRKDEVRSVHSDADITDELSVMDETMDSDEEDEKEEVLKKRIVRRAVSSSVVRREKKRRQYFRTDAGRAVFVLREQIIEVSKRVMVRSDITPEMKRGQSNTLTPTAAAAAAAASAGRLLTPSFDESVLGTVLENHDSGSTLSTLITGPSVSVDDAIVAERISVNDIVQVPESGYGMVRFVGEVEHMPGAYFFGVELLQRRGHHAGRVKGVEYFACREDSFGLLCKPQSLKIGVSIDTHTEQRLLNECPPLSFELALRSPTDWSSEVLGVSVSADSDEKSTEHSRTVSSKKKPKPKRKFEDEYIMDPVTDLIGGGTYGDVFRCKHRTKKIGKHRRKYAVKRVNKVTMISMAGASTRRLLQNLRTEIACLKKMRAARKKRRPGYLNVMQFVDVFEDQRYVYIISNYANGGTLYDMIREESDRLSTSVDTSGGSLIGSTSPIADASEFDFDSMSATVASRPPSVSDPVSPRLGLPRMASAGSSLGSKSPRRMLSPIIKAGKMSYDKVVRGGVSSLKGALSPRLTSSYSTSSMIVEPPSEPISLLSEEAIKHIMQDVLYGLLHLSRFDIAHLDLNPSNIMRVQHPTDKSRFIWIIIDFGMARVIPRFHISCGVRPAGTAYFVAPEVTNGTYHQLSDVWSFGVILFFLCFGYPPFGLGSMDSDQMIFREIRKGFDIEERKEGKGPWIPADYQSTFGCSDEVVSLIEWCLQMDLTKRCTVQEALDHEWFAPPLLSTMSVPGSAASSRSSRGWSTGSAPRRLPLTLQNAFSTFTKRCEFRSLVARIFAADLSFEERKKVRAVFKHFDTDGSMSVSRSQFVSGMLGFDNVHKTEGELRALFDAMDVDRKGTLDLAQLESVFAYQKIVATDERLERAFSELDGSGSGFVSVGDLEEKLFELRSLNDKFMMDDYEVSRQWGFIRESVTMTHSHDSLSLSLDPIHEESRFRGRVPPLVSSGLTITQSMPVPDSLISERKRAVIDAVRAADKKGDGRINKKEFIACLHPLLLSPTLHRHYSVVDSKMSVEPSATNTFFKATSVSWSSWLSNTQGTSTVRSGSGAASSGASSDSEDSDFDELDLYGDSDDEDW